MRVMVLSICLAATPVFAQQDWGAVQALPSDTPVRVHELGGRRGHVEGRLLSVESMQLTLIRRGKPVTIPKAQIGRIEQRRRDPLWEGMILGALYAVAMQAAYGDDSWTRKQVLAGFSTSIAVGAFIDYQIQGSRTVYRAPDPNVTITMLRLSF